MTPEPLHAAPVEPSIADLLRRLVDDGNHLIRTEIRLAKAEVRDNLNAAKSGAAAIGLGAILLLGAIFTLLGAAVGFLTPYVGAGFAALIVGGATLLVGLILIVFGGRRLSVARVIPDKAAASVRADAQAIKGSVG